MWLLLLDVRDSNPQVDMKHLWHVVLQGDVMQILDNMLERVCNDVALLSKQLWISGSCWEDMYKLETDYNVNYSAHQENGSLFACDDAESCSINWTE